MAGDEIAKKAPSIPSWQHSYQSSTPSDPAPADSSTNQTTPAPDLDPVEHARHFLDNESIKNASRERKIAFLETKGLNPEQIDDLLSSEPDTQDPKEDSYLKTVHDSTTTVEPTRPQAEVQQAPMQNDPASEARVAPRSDVPPIITYPEFLLKPQKPPPLVTFERLANAAYFLAGVSALTYGASKYLVQPMLESLTDSRHDLAITTQSSLCRLNSKLESSVSQVPYIPPLHSKQPPTHDISDTESIDSDPTELFHRDIATQTTPLRSRSSSLGATPSAGTTIEAQSSRLTALKSSLQSLLSSTTTHFAEDSLQTSLTDLQSTIDNIYQPETYNTTYASSYSYQHTSKNKQPGEPDSQAVKFKQDIRALKGAFLSSRNFPTARPAAPFTRPQSQR